MRGEEPRENPAGVPSNYFYFCICSPAASWRFPPPTPRFPPRSGAPGLPEDNPLAPQRVLWGRGPGCEPSARAAPPRGQERRGATTKRGWGALVLRAGCVGGGVTPEAPLLLLSFFHPFFSLNEGLGRWQLFSRPERVRGPVHGERRSRGPGGPRGRPEGAAAAGLWEPRGGGGAAAVGLPQEGQSRGREGRRCRLHSRPATVLSRDPRRGVEASCIFYAKSNGRRRVAQPGLEWQGTRREGGGRDGEVAGVVGRSVSSSVFRLAGSTPPGKYSNLEIDGPIVKLFLRHCCKFDLDSPSPPSLPAVLLPGRSGSWHRPHACLLRSRLCKTTAGLSRPILPTLAPGRVSLNLKKGTSKPTSVNCHVNFDANNVQIMTKIANHAL
ncbi:translation initiation factor IF-2-like [Canis lupus dingo]|uniref:translation initiation factor IF-2-like n=1 Tax=Canis lupus dingo TaxID=286419 RepID=UPI0020C2AC45|nr:translation initiation factor IF-2-like [Canis lupus dingo]